MIETYFTSDLHIGHEKVARIRHDEGMDPEIDIDAFMATGQHDAILAANWDALVNPWDIVWVLGDISSGGSAGQRTALDWIQARHGRKHLILGNHDGPHPMYRDSHRWMPRYLEVFDSVQLAARRRIPLAEGHVNAILSHFPYGPVITPATWGRDEWRELVQYPGYAVHPDGHVRGRFGRVLKPTATPKGYRYITISGVGKRYIHRLVALAFHGQPSDPSLEVAHNNGNNGDNRAVNLRWATHTENMADAKRHGTATGGSMPGASNPNSRLTADDVTYIRQSTETGASLAAKFGVTGGHISAIRLGSSWIQRDGLDHKPEPRHLQWRLPDCGDYLLHGHVHSRNRRNVGHKREIHVGLDAWGYKPVSLKAVHQLVNDIEETP